MRVTSNFKVLSAAFYVSTTLFIPMAFTDSMAATPQIAKMKAAACNIDGFLQNGDADTLDMAANSSCYFLQRAVDPWATVPAFPKVAQSMAALKAAAPNKAFVIGMFIPEAIPSITVDLVDARGNSTPIPFGDYCLTGTLGQFGANTCVGDINNSGYQGYLKNIEQQAIALGITVFQFGQVKLMDPSQKAASLFTQMRTTGSNAGVTIMLSAQTDATFNGAYLQNFDFIVGGSYMNRFGSVLTGALQSGQGAESTGSALLWADEYRSLARNVFIETDWWSLDDDSHRFAELAQSDRQRVANSLYNYFASLGVAFVVPYYVPLQGGPTIASTCVGAQTNIYSASPAHCGDAAYYNQMLQAGPQPSSTQNLALKNLVLNPGDYIENLSSSSVPVMLKMQGDGNLVAYETTDPNAVNPPVLWSSNTGGQSCASCTANLQSDGNVVLRFANGTPYWRTGTSGNLGAELAILPVSPYVRVMDTAQDLLWMSSNHFGFLTIPQNAYVQLGGYQLVMQSDANLVLYPTGNRTNPVWASNVTTTGCGTNQCQAVFNANGNFYTQVAPIDPANNDNLWSSMTNNNADAQLILSITAPYLQIINTGNMSLWQVN